MDENLVGYLLKALDSAGQQAVESQLEKDPTLQARLKAVEQRLALLASDAEPPQPPPGLVLNTLARVAEYRCRSLPQAPPSPRSHLARSGWRWLRRPDALVAAALILLTTGLVLTALLPLWRQYQRQKCADNLRGFGASLASYSNTHDGAFPRIEPEGPRSRAGMFVPMLHDAGALRLDQVSTSCPAQKRKTSDCPSVPELERLAQTDPARFEQMLENLAGSYGYSLGYLEDGVYQGLSRSCGDQLPIMADRLQSLEQLNSLNHGGTGQNVLYIGGHVLWQTGRKVGIDGDDIYVNHKDQVRAGLGCNDTVLGSGTSCPGGVEE